MSKKKITREELENRAWFRALKVLYSIIFIGLLVFAFAIGFGVDHKKFLSFGIAIVSSIILMWLIKKIFYYIITGEIKWRKF